MPSNITEKEDIFSKQRNTDRMRVRQCCYRSSAISLVSMQNVALIASNLISCRCEVQNNVSKRGYPYHSTKRAKKIHARRLQEGQVVARQYVQRVFFPSFASFFHPNTIKQEPKCTEKRLIFKRLFLLLLQGRNEQFKFLRSQSIRRHV